MANRQGGKKGGRGPFFGLISSFCNTLNIGSLKGKKRKYSKEIPIADQSRGEFLFLVVNFSHGNRGIRGKNTRIG